MANAADSLVLDIAASVASYRKSVCPRTSYESSNEIIVVVDKITDRTSHFTLNLSESLRNSNEFHMVTVLIREEIVCENFVSSLNNQVVLFMCLPDDHLITFVRNIIYSRKTKLVFCLFKHFDINDAINSKFNDFKNYSISNLDDINVLSENFSPYVLFTTYSKLVIRSEWAPHSTPTELLVGSWGHPSVRSRRQFKFIWCTTEAVTDCKRRVLARLVNKSIKRGSDSFKLRPEYLDQLLNRLCVNDNCTDAEVYETLRKIFVGKTLNGNEVSPLEIPLSVREKADDWDEDGNGRSQFMTKRTIECLPLAFKSKVKTLLDYGCAEGAITAHLRQQLNVPPSHAFGADVRHLDAQGFTFLLLPKESEEPPIPGQILPQLASQSVDLITAAMVFHHIKHLQSVIMELRRVISPTGLLVIREHDCCSPYEAAFLDITHGLYSLVYSDPIEWPAFLDEYNAWYKSRDQWNEILSSCGFERLFQPENRMAEQHYNASVVRNTNNSTQGKTVKETSLNLKIPNVIKAYYAVYIPKPLTTLSNTSTATNMSVTNKNPASRTLSHQFPMSKSASEVTGDLSNRTQGENSDSIGIKRMRENEFIDSSSGTNIKPLANGNVHLAEMKSTTDSADKVESYTTEARWVLYESTKHIGSFYVIDPSTKQPQWIREPLDLAKQTTTVTSSLPVGTFMNPITCKRSAISSIVYAQQKSI